MRVLFLSCPLRLVVRTPEPHSGDIGSNPIGGATFKKLQSRPNIGQTKNTACKGGLFLSPAKLQDGTDTHIFSRNFKNARG